MLETIVPFLCSTLKLAVDPRAWLIAAVVFAVGWFKGLAHTERKWQVLIVAERAEQDRKIKEFDERAFVTIDRAQYRNGEAQCAHCRTGRNGRARSSCQAPVSVY